jgi:inward rectifier potassium channel
MNSARGGLEINAAVKPEPLEPHALGAEQPVIEKTTQLRDDLGIGRIASERGRGRFLKRDGSFSSKREGLGMLESFSPYYWLLSVSWPVFFGVAALAFVTLNLIFASLYLLLGSDALSSAAKLSAFERAFFFSVETLSTIGYGHIVPQSLAAHWLSTVQAFTGVLSVALITGLVFSKFSKPAARILFSRNALIAPYRDQTGLMIRVVNGLKSEIIEIEAQITISRFETTNGQRSRRFYPLKLERSGVSFFPLAWTVVHPITQESPLWEVTEAELTASELEILVVLHGIDDVMYQRVHSRTSYGAEDVVWRAKFSDMYTVRTDGGVGIDARRLSLYEPV